MRTTVRTSAVLAEAGIKCICYNFMPVFDWTRTQLDHELGLTVPLPWFTIRSRWTQVNPLESDSDLTLPGWDSKLHQRTDLKAVVAEYNAMLPRIDLWNNSQYFLERSYPGSGRVRREHGNP